MFSMNIATRTKAYLFNLQICLLQEIYSDFEEIEISINIISATKWERTKKYDVFSAPFLTQTRLGAVN